MRVRQVAWVFVAWIDVGWVRDVDAGERGRPRDCFFSARAVVSWRDDDVCFVSSYDGGYLLFLPQKRPSLLGLKSIVHEAKTGFTYVSGTVKETKTGVTPSRRLGSHSEESCSKKSVG